MYIMERKLDTGFLILDRDPAKTEIHYDSVRLPV